MEGIKENPIAYSLKEVPIDSITVWEEAQSRTLDRADIDSLARSIREEGLQNPPMVQRDGANSYLLMAGQRRLEALRKLGSKTIPVLILSRESSHDIEDAKAVSVIENLHRRDMSASEMAASCEFLAEKMGVAAASRALGVSRRTFREYLGYGAVPDKIREMVPKTISRRDAIRICRVVTVPSDALDVIQRISRYDHAQKKRYVDALEQLGSAAEHSEVQRLANSFRARQNVSLRFSKNQARGLSKLSREKNLEPGELAQKIVSDYLSRRGFGR